MDKVAELNETDIPKILLPTIGIFVPLLEEKRSLILSTPRRTFKYGTTDRHKLDVYYPAEPLASGKTPVLFFLYGGSYMSGDRILPAPADLAYANVGAYFSRKGFTTVIPDYRITPEAVFPDPSKDARDAIVWITENPHSLSYGSFTSAGLDSIFVMGHSAGAITVSTMVLLSLLPESVQSLLKGAILIAGAYAWDTEVEGVPGIPPEVTNQFFGSVDKAKENTPLPLLETFPKDKLSALPPILIAHAESEPDSFLRVGKRFHDALSTLTEKQVPKIIGRGHNHISTTFALMSGQGEQWADELAVWIQAAL